MSSDRRDVHAAKSVFHQVRVQCGQALWLRSCGAGKRTYTPVRRTEESARSAGEVGDAEDLAQVFRLAERQGASGARQTHTVVDSDVGEEFSNFRTGVVARSLGSVRDEALEQLAADVEGAY